MKKKSRISSQRFELTLYEFLGVKLFRSLVFRLERFLRKKDGLKNENYHIFSYETNELNAFVKYLFYNGTIHLRNAIVLSIFLFFYFLFWHSFEWYLLFPILLLIKDLYCIMLQRYNYLRISDRKASLDQKLQKRVNRNAAYIVSTRSSQYDRQFAVKDLAFIQKLRASIDARETVVLDKEDELSLNRLSAFFIRGDEKTDG